jgi:predicted nucleotidyltransferase
LGQVRQFAAELKSARPEVEKVGLFGSYATDMYGPASDVDLLIILQQSRKRFLDRIPDLIPDNVSVGCDVFPYTAEEIENMKRDDNPWLRHVLNEIVWL